MTEGPAPARTSARAATIYEVARLAGVSHQTVSRYMADRSKLRAATSEKVERAMAELKYTPNLTARSLRTKGTYRLLALVPGSSPYFPSRMLSGAATTAQAAGYQLDVVALEGTGPERTERLRRILDGGPFAGALSFVPISGPDLLQAQERIPVVVAGDYDDQMRGQGRISDGSAARAIVAHIAALGHHRIAHIAGPQEWPAARNRLAVYRRAVQEAGLEDCGSAEADWSAASGYAAANALLTGPSFTAIFAANDQLAIGAIRALHDRGLRVPADVSVVGWDDHPESAFLIPSLTTVHMDLEAQGSRSMEQLLVALKPGGTPLPEPGPTGMRLVLRESSGAAPIPAATGAGQTSLEP
ncbi:LacI family DNA-binding transcriptional regulator [Arthrobacter sp. AFG7.2]|uniref:LacI family DNA-binding transcriptional regulator n=1 Tax=Arthrobacter sp. AFG7.2 TaxID=1688693 RepID=UPI0016702372|nr:LacI family DNA-binding transcriptional regulator [Arthrobacter sp. AFG7.2]